MILPHDPPLSAVLSLCTDHTLINGPLCQTQILSRTRCPAITSTYCRCTHTLTQSVLHTMHRDRHTHTHTHSTDIRTITHNCLGINICWSITFLFSIHFQPDTKSIDLWDISLSLSLSFLAFQSLIYRTQYYIMLKEWQIPPCDALSKNANLPVQASKGYTLLLSEIWLNGKGGDVTANEVLLEMQQQIWVEKLLVILLQQSKRGQGRTEWRGTKELTPELWLERRFHQQDTESARNAQPVLLRERRKWDTGALSSVAKLWITA